MNRKSYVSFGIITVALLLFVMPVSTHATLLFSQLPQLQKVTIGRMTKDLNVYINSSSAMSVVAYGGVPVSVIIAGTGGASNVKLNIFYRNYTIDEVLAIKKQYDIDMNGSGDPTVFAQNVDNPVVISSMESLGFLDSNGVWASQPQTTSGPMNSALLDTDILNHLKQMLASSNLTPNGSAGGAVLGGFSPIFAWYFGNETVPAAKFVSTATYQNESGGGRYPLHLAPGNVNAAQKLAITDMVEQAEIQGNLGSFNSDEIIGFKNLGILPAPTCAPSATSIATNDTVTWTPVPSGSGSYSFTWTGTDSNGNFTRSGTPLTVLYATAGTYSASLTETDTATNETLNPIPCTGSVTVTDAPATPAPTTPAPTAPISSGPFDWITNGLVPCGAGTGQELSATTTLPAGSAVNAHACGFNDFVQLINNVIAAMIMLSVFVAAGMFIYIGFLLMTAQGDKGKVTLARKIAINLAWGFLFVLVAWLIVHTLTALLFNPQVNIFMSSTPTS